MQMIIINSEFKTIRGWQYFFVSHINMIRNFIGIKLGHKQKFSFQPQDGLVAYIITGLALLGTQASLYCVQKDQHILIAKLKGSKSNFKLKLQMSEDSIKNLYVISEDQSEIFVLGYEIKIQQISNNQEIIDDIEEPSTLAKGGQKYRFR
ncbi:hypothetical protein pb186bvf_004042 [Paramecium bursaria]